MKVLFAASEAVPFCKTGGLADVAGALPVRLAKEGHIVTLVLPLYRAIDRNIHKLKKTAHRFTLPIGSNPYEAEIWQAPESKNLKVMFIGCDYFYDRAGLYGPTSGSDHLDNDQRYSFFCRAVLEMARAIKFKPDVIHVHDWQMGLLPAMVKSIYRDDPFFKNAGTVFSIHNMAYQGIFEPSSFSFTGLPPSEFSLEGVEYYGKVSFMKGGLAYSDAIGTVSPTYAKEIASNYEFGYGLEGLLQHRKDRLRGILNGLDTDAWNPETDPFLASNFTAETVKKRAACKLDLRKIAGFNLKSPAPILGFVGRLDRQKGVEFILGIAPDLLKKDIQLVFLGVGDPTIQKKLLELQAKFRSRVFVETTFSEPLAHKIYGGSDLFLMPSLFEPCGLGQMIAMRYGALPVVTPTGGLADTVVPYHKPKGCGFVAEAVTAPAVWDAIQSGLQEFADPVRWTRTQKRAMKIDFSWEKSIPAYEEVYAKARIWRKKSSDR